MKKLIFGAMMLLAASALTWIYYDFLMVVILILAVQGNEIVQRANNEINKHMDI